jgi:hypothetical protein
MRLFGSFGRLRADRACGSAFVVAQVRLSALGLAALVLTVVAVTFACSSAPSHPEFADPDVAGRTTNPEGLPYPTDNLGGHERAGGRPGQRIPNLTFQAYVDGDRAAGLKTISLADYFDPAQKRFKVIDLQVAATWCTVCSAVVSATLPAKEKLAKEGAVFLEVIVAGGAATYGPSLDEVDRWVTQHQSTLTTAIDVRGRRLSPLGLDPTVVPYDMLIDTRTMEILESSAGAPLSVEKYVRDALTYVATHPPSY